MDYYFINNFTIYFAGKIVNDNDYLYELNFYKAVTDVIFECDDSLYIAASNALSEIVAKKVQNISINGLKNIKLEITY